MVLYYFYFLLVSLLSLLESYFKRNQIVIIGTIIFLALVLTVGFKSDTFGDYCSYALIFYDSVSIIYFPSVISEYQFHYESGFEIFLVMLPKSLIDHSIFIFSFIAFISLGVHFYGIKKMSPYFFLSILLYFSHNFILKELAQVRSGVASSFILLSIYFLANNKLFKFLITTIFASTFHITALVAFGAFIFDRVIKQIRDPRFIYLIILSATLLFGFINLSSYIFDLIVNYKLAPSRFFVYFTDCPEAWNDKFGYIGCGRETINSASIGIFSNLATIKYIVITLLTILFYHRLKRASIFFRPIFNFYFVGTCWIIFFNDFGIFASRIASILTVGEIILVPIFALLIKPKYLAKILIIILVTPIFYINVNRLFEEASRLDLPYSAIYTGEVCPDHNPNWLLNKKIIIE